MEHQSRDPLRERYFEGFQSGVEARKTFGKLVSWAPQGDALARIAQDRVLTTGRRLSPEERLKREHHPADLWPTLTANAQAARYPDGGDVFRYKYHGLFRAEGREGFMCRLRLPGGAISAEQLRVVGQLSRRYGQGTVQITSRAGLQLRGVAPANAVELLQRLHEVGIATGGSGGDSIRNVTTNATAGVDQNELIDTMPFVRAVHHLQLSSRRAQSLPRKLTVSFDGGGGVPALTESSDVGFVAVRVSELPSQVGFRLLLGGAPSHGRHARDMGVVVAPEHALGALQAILDVFTEHGDRTNRRRARLAYLLESWGRERFLSELAGRLLPTQSLIPLPREASAKDASGRHVAAGAHLGVHAQRQEGLYYLGVSVPVGELSASQAHELADLSARFGNSDLRFTPFQNVLLVGIPLADVQAVSVGLQELGLSDSAARSPVRLITCTGSRGCAFAHADTKRVGQELVSSLQALCPPDVQLSLHVSGCHRSCALHLLADVGLQAIRGAGEAVQVERFNVWLSGRPQGAGAFCRVVARGVAVTALGSLLSRVVEQFTSQRRGQESFKDFVGRVGIQSFGLSADGQRLPETA